MTINADMLNTFWILICAVLVITMQAGFCCVESGFVRSKNSINVAIKNFVYFFCIAAAVFWLFGYGIMFGTSYLGLFGIGLIWMLVHVTILIIVAKIIKAPFFFVAVGSQANVGGAASAPVVAAAFSPALAPVGVLMAVLGYALGTYGALLCQYLMAWVAGG